MKAIVKATGEIVEIVQFLDNDKFPTTYDEDELEFFPNYNYWDRLLHQYAGMAMQGMLSNTSLITVLFDATKDHDELLKEVIICSHEYAHTLVEKLKEKEEKK